MCGEFISATNLALLDKLGIGDAWRAEAGPEIRRVGFFGGDVCAEAACPSKGGFGRALGRDILDRLLLDAARVGRRRDLPAMARRRHASETATFMR